MTHPTPIWTSSGVRYWIPEEARFTDGDTPVAHKATRRRRKARSVTARRKTRTLVHDLLGPAYALIPKRIKDNRTPPMVADPHKAGTPPPTTHNLAHALTFGDRSSAWKYLKRNPTLAKEYRYIRVVPTATPTAKKPRKAA
jgi:hypothetical protein